MLLKVQKCLCKEYHGNNCCMDFTFWYFKALWVVEGFMKHSSHGTCHSVGDFSLSWKGQKTHLHIRSEDLFCHMRVCVLIWTSETKSPALYPNTAQNNFTIPRRSTLAAVVIKAPSRGKRGDGVTLLKHKGCRKRRSGQTEGSGHGSLSEETIV